MFATLATYSPLFRAYGPILLFMLLPVWIPVVTAAAGRIVAALRSAPEPTPVEQLRAVRAAEVAPAA
ncbi:MAG TPA: hypothetical protein VF426_14210 [Marmoricola sp.]